MSRKYTIGGQAVLEGVMMRGPEQMAIAVRQETGGIALRREAVHPAKGLARKPFIRGVVGLVNTLKMSVSTLMASAEMMGEEPEQPSKFEAWLSRKTGKDVMDIAMSVAVVLGLGLAIGLFFVLPTFLAGLLHRWVEEGVWLNLLEGVIRLAILFVYLTAVSAMKEMRRVFSYHGAEHKVVNCYESGKPLTVAGARSCSTANPRCGTSFLLLVMVMSILVFSLTGWTGPWWGRILVRLALLPVVASLSYEVLMGLAKHDNLLVRILRWPGMQMQKLTTREPSDDMLEVSLAAFIACMPEEERASEVDPAYRLPDEAALPREEAGELAEADGTQPAPDCADADQLDEGQPHAPAAQPEVRETALADKAAQADRPCPAPATGQESPAAAPTA